MGERVINHSQNVTEKLEFRPQGETLQNFMAGAGNKKYLHMTVGRRQEYWHRHEPGFADGELRVASFVAHPDDTALDSGLAHLLVENGRVNGKKKTRLAVIAATPGQNGIRPQGFDGDLGAERIQEDVKGTERLGADFYANLGFLDGNIPYEVHHLIQRFTQYLTELQPHILLLPDPSDIVHDDHVAVSLAAMQAVILTKQNPIVAYTEFQNGDSKITKEHIGFELTGDAYEVVTAAYLDHTTQTSVMTDDIVGVLRRPIVRAESLRPEISLLGLARQDSRFSSIPLATYLGKSAVQLPGEERGFHESNQERISSGPTVIFERNQT